MTTNDDALAHPRRRRHRADRALVADRGAAADADEQPGPGERGEPRRAGGLRRHRQGRAQLGVVRRPGAHPHHARRRRDHARAERQAGRCDAHPRVGAARADRQLQPGRRLGQLGGVPPAGGPRPDDVRPDDRRLVDLHRHPGHPPGHLRDVRGRGGQALRRHLGRHDHADRRTRRHGWRPAARGDDERRRRDLRRVRPGPDHPAHRAPLSRRAGRLARARRRAGRRGPRRAKAPVHRRSGQRGRAVPRHCWSWTRRSTSSPTRPPRTTRCHTCRSACRSRSGTTRRSATPAASPRTRRPRWPPMSGDGRVPGQGRRGLRLRQLDPRRGAQGRLRPGVRVPGLRPGVHPAAVLRGQGTVPLGCALRRPRRHRRHRPGDPRAVPRQRAAAQVDHHGRRAGRVPGPAGAHLLARVRRAPPRRPEVQRDGRVR